MEPQRYPDADIPFDEDDEDGSPDLTVRDEPDAAVPAVHELDEVGATRGYQLRRPPAYRPRFVDPETRPIVEPGPDVAADVAAGPGRRAQVLPRAGGLRLSNERAYRVLEFRESLDGGLRGELIQELLASIYRGPTAKRWLLHQAKERERGESLLMLVRPTGTIAGVFLSGTGRKAAGSISRRVKRAAREQFSELFARRRQRRTSRAPRRALSSRRRRPRSSRRPRRRRTSRR